MIFAFLLLQLMPHVERPLHQTTLVQQNKNQPTVPSNNKTQIDSNQQNKQTTRFTPTLSL